MTLEPLRFMVDFRLDGIDEPIVMSYDEILQPGDEFVMRGSRWAVDRVDLVKDGKIDHRVFAHAVDAA